MEDPLTGDYPVRGAVEEEEEEAQSYGPSFVEPPEVQWNEFGAAETNALRQPKLLVIAEGPAAATLADVCFADKEVVGEIRLHKLQNAEDALPRGDFAAHTAPISCTAGGNVLLVACEKPVLAERSGAWFEKLRSEVQPAQILIISAIPAHRYVGQGDAADEVLIFTVPTSAAANAAAAAGIPQLPSGNLVSGLAAAVISQCQVRSVPAVSLVGVQMGPVPDRTHLVTLAAAIGRLLQSLAGGDVQQRWLSNQGTVAKACTRADRAYRASSTSLLYS